MKKSLFLLAAFVLSLGFLFAQPLPPELVMPFDGAQGIPEQGTELVWLQLDYMPGPFLIEIFLDTSSLFPAPAVYTGPGMEFWLPPEFHFPTGPLLSGMQYFWKIRVTDTGTMLSSESVVWSFTVASTAQTAILSGLILPGNPAFDVSGVTVSCPGAHEPSTLVTGPDGYYSFIVDKGGNYVITPVKALFEFNPASFVFTDVQADQVQDFTMNSLLPHAACNPIPVDGDVYVPHDLGRISWQYIPQPGYALPTEFLVYIPADAPEPIGIVPYAGRAINMFLDLEGEIQGESVDAKVKSRNGHGEGIDILSWSWGMSNPGSFHTGGGGGGRPKCDYPGYAGKVDFADIVMKLNVDAPTPVLFRSCCSVFLDTGIVPLTIVYQGRALPCPLDSTRCYFYAPQLQPNTIYHWFVRMVDPVTGDTLDTNNYAFRTAESLIGPNPPLLVSPEPGAPGIPPEGVDLVFDQDPWLVESFFDIFLDTDPDFPQPPVYTGSLLPSGPYFEFHKDALLAEQPYNWYVRYTDFMDNWYANSLVRQFTTGQYVVPSSNISGTISSVHNVSACTVNCPQAVLPNSVSTGIYGTFSFTVNNGLNPIVTPTKQGYFFTPGFYQFNNISANQTANFTMTSLKPWLASQPIPGINAQNISPMLGNLQWEYYNNIYYSPPDGFTVLFGPVGDVLPLEEVSFSGEGVYSAVIPPSLLPLAYDTEYEWRVVPHNEAGGESEGVVTWTFTTAPPPVPELLLPVNHVGDIDPEGAYLTWYVGEGYQIDSFFDVYCDIDPDFPSPPFYSGPLPPSRYQFVYFTGDLLQAQVYFWKVRCHAFGEYWESAVFDFVTGVNALITYSNITGTISGNCSVSGVTVTCPGACLPNQAVTGVAGTYSFTVKNGFSYTVTPAKALYSFNPAFQTSPVMTGNWVANFWMSSLLPNTATLIWPPNLSDNIIPPSTQLQWTYINLDGYTPPTGFEVYFPADNPVPIIVMAGRDPIYTVEIDSLQPFTTYIWKVIPYNDNGPAEGVETWEFTTEGLPTQIPVLLYPPNHETEVTPDSLLLQFDLPEWVPDSFFDIYCDIDPSFPNGPLERVYYTPGRTFFEYQVAALLDEQPYYWFVRYSNGVDYWSSQVWDFITRHSFFTRFTISGAIQNFGTATLPLDSVKVTCPGACIPATVTTGTNGAFSFTVSQGFSYTVTPNKQGYYFTPASRFYNNVQGNQTGNFTIYKVIPNGATLIWPPYYMQNLIPPSTYLQWTYTNLDGYTPPTGFEVYFPADNPVPIIVMVGREPIYTVEIDSLQPFTPYDWKVVPFNGDGWAEYIQEWGFETGEPYPANEFITPELYIHPGDGSSNEDPGLVMVWGDQPSPYGRHNFPVDSFFDVFLDTDPDLSDAPIIYSGPGLVNPLNPQQYYCYSPELEWGTLYCWQLRLTLPTMEVYYSPVWHFVTAYDPIPRPVPVLVSPPAGEENVPPRGLDLTWSYDPWYVDSFFDVFCDPDSTFPGPPVYSGPGNPVRTILQYHKAALLAEQPYYWFVRYSDFVDYWYSKSPFQPFTTGSYTPPPPPVLLAPLHQATVPPINIEFSWECDPDWWVESFFDVYCDLEPGIPDSIIYSGTGQELLHEGIFTFNQAYLLDEEAYNWYVRITDLMSGLSTDSEIRSFYTEPPNPLTLLYPPDGEPGLPPEEITLQFDHALWQIDSFFDIYVDIDPDFPNPPIYSGPLEPERALLLHTIGPLMENQLFHWKVRVTQGMNQWTSAAYNFTTGVFSTTSHNVSGTLYNQNNIATGGRRIDYFANNVFMGYTTSSLNPPYGYYSINLPDIANVVYKVVPAKPTVIQYWAPTWMTYTNLTADQSNQDYYLSSYTPNPAIQPVPYNLATNVSINVGYLQWTYIQQSHYGEPLGFEVYFPAGSPEPYAVVPYVRDSLFTVDIPTLEYITPYNWEVIPYNDYGWAEYFEQWTFTTEEAYPPPMPVYVYPGNHTTDVSNAGLIMVWGPPPEREGFPAESFFDVYCDIDSLFSAPPIYSGPAHQCPTHTPYRYVYVPNLALNTHYYWIVVVTDTLTGLSTEGEIWDFSTAQTPAQYQQALLVAPPDQAEDVYPVHTQFVWEMLMYPPDSFFDVFVSIDSAFTEPPVYTGYGIPVFPYVSRWLYEHSLLLDEQAYYWYVRVTNLINYWFSESEVWTFTTGSATLPPPELTLAFDGTLSWTAVPGAEAYIVYRSYEPYGDFLPVWTTFDLSWHDPEFSVEQAYYYVTATAGGGGGGGGARPNLPPLNAEPVPKPDRRKP